MLFTAFTEIQIHVFLSLLFTHSIFFTLFSSFLSFPSPVNMILRYFCLSLLIAILPLCHPCASLSFCHFHSPSFTVISAAHLFISRFTCYFWPYYWLIPLVYLFHSLDIIIFYVFGVFSVTFFPLLCFFYHFFFLSLTYLISWCFYFFL